MAHALYVKNSITGEFERIPAIVGPKGPKGDPGSYAPSAAGIFDPLGTASHEVINETKTITEAYASGVIHAIYGNTAKVGTTLKASLPLSITATKGTASVTSQLPVQNYFPTGIRAIIQNGVTYADSLTPTKVTKKIHHLALTGQEDWTKSTSTNPYFYIHIGDLNTFVDGVVLSDRFNTVDITGNATSIGIDITNSTSNEDRLLIRPNNYASMTVAEFKELIYGTVVDLVYTTPIETTITDSIWPFAVLPQGTITVNTIDGYQAVLDADIHYDPSLFNATVLTIPQTLTDEQKAQARMNIEAASIYDTIDLENWSDVQRLVRTGLAGKMLSIGDQLVCEKSGTRLVWDIIGIDHDTPNDSQYAHSITIQLHDLFGTYLVFDATEALFAFPDGLAAGTYNFKVTQHSWVSADVGKTFQFTLTQAIPAGGQIVLAGTYNVTLAGSSLKTYSGPSFTTVIETATITEGSAGTSLGDVSNSISGHTNSLQRAFLGNSRWSHSALRQWLNSDELAGSVWESKNEFDRAPSWTSSTAGFLNGMDADFLAVVGEVTKETALNTVTDGGGKETLTEKFFLLSRSEVYGGNEVTGGEGTPYAYYSEYSDLTAPGTGNDTNRIKYRSGTAYYWWLRSPNAGGASWTCRVYAAGGVDSGGASYSTGVAPACVIY